MGARESDTPWVVGLNTTLNPIFKGEGTEILFQSPKSFQAEHFHLKSFFIFFVGTGIECAPIICPRWPLGMAAWA